MRTAGYLLANRIPVLAQRLLGVLPSTLAARVLLRAIARNAWTFAGSGAVRSHAGRACRIEIVDNPIAIPGCPWHAAVFGHLFRELVAADASVGLGKEVKGSEPLDSRI